jgi:HlyD family secretion protein
MARNFFKVLTRPADGAGDDMRPEILIGAAAIAVFFVGFLGWAAFVPLDAAAYAPGQVAVADHRQTIQHKEGGVVSRINVKEGQYVRAGEVLIEMAGADVIATQKALTVQVIGLRAERARLQSEQASLPAIVPPPEFAALFGVDRAEADRALAVQDAQFRSRASSLSSHKAVLRKRVSELNEQVGGVERQIQAVGEQKRLIAEELGEVKSLANQGYAPISQVRALERNQADLEGRLGEYTAMIAQARQQSGGLDLQVLQLETDEKEQVAKELRDVEFQLNELLPRLNAANDQLSRQQVRATASGSVVSLSVFTAGGVIAPGQRLMDIVPDKTLLVIEAQVSPMDIDAVRIGMTTEVRLGAERDRTLPVLKGALTKLSADALVNEKTGGTYFIAEVTIPPDQLEKLNRAKAGSYDLRPGLPAQVIIPVTKRTALQFLLDPLTRTLWRSFRER